MQIEAAEHAPGRKAAIQPYAWRLTFRGELCVQRKISMVCPECTRLLARSMALERAHFAAFGSMLEATAGPAPEFVTMLVANEKARDECDLARLELQQHQRTHDGRSDIAQGRAALVHATGRVPIPPSQSRRP